MTVTKKSFGKSATATTNEHQPEVKSAFIRSKQDNTLFPQIQIKDLKPLLTDDCVNYVDADGFAYKISSSVEEDYVVVTNKDGVETKHKNVSEWKGRSRKEGVISVDSYLGRENIKREAKGETPFEITDFTVEKKKRLKYEKGTTIDGIKFENSFEVAKYFLSQWVYAMKIQTQVEKYILIIGKGKCHRNFLHLPKDYKSNRTGERPLLLNEVRQHILDEYPSEEAPSGFETDEIVDMKAFKHYISFRKTGRISGIKTSPDKDAKNTAGILFDPTKDFHFKQPQVWLIHSSDKTVGEMELVKSGLKACGLMNTAYQMVCQDASDFYGSRLTMPPEMKPDILYGDTAFYKDFINLTTPKEVLQKVVDVFLMFYPDGVQFTSHLGKEINEDTMWWLQQCFACQYMLRSLTDKTQFVDLLEKFKVDYTKVTDNNVEKVLPFLSEEELRLSVKDNTSEVQSIIELLSDKSGKAADKLQRKDLAVSLLEDLKTFDNLFQQEKK